MKQTKAPDDPQSAAGRNWAAFRGIVGLAQMAGAICTALLLWQRGVTKTALLAFYITSLFALASRTLFRLPVTETRRSLGAKVLSEFLGTFALVFAGTGAIIINDVSGGAITHAGIALTFGLVILAMIYTFGDISGAHFNPAVTLGFFAARRFPAVLLVPYLLSQCLGAVSASLVLHLLFAGHATLGATLPAGSELQSFVLETLLTFFLMLTILNVSTGAKEKGITAGIAVGAVIALEAMFAGPICGASMNPARSLAPALVSLRLDHLWIYLLAPPLGAAGAMLACRCIREPGCCSQPQPESPS